MGRAVDYVTGYVGPELPIPIATPPGYTEATLGGRMPGSWMTGFVPDLGQPQAELVHRTPHTGDPRTPPPAEVLRKIWPGQRGQVSWPDLRFATVESWKQKIARLLSDGVPRTFNRISMELAGVSSDEAAFTVADNALWELVERRQVEFSQEVPVQFRLTGTTARPQYTPGGPKPEKGDLWEVASRGVTRPAEVVGYAEGGPMGGFVELQFYKDGAPDGDVETVGRQQLVRLIEKDWRKQQNPPRRRWS